MPRDDRDAALLWDMLHHARLVVAFVSGKTWPDYEPDELLRAAVERKVSIVGEASSRVSRGFQGLHPEIPWSLIAKQRHRLVHDYGIIENEIIWRVATVHIPELLRLLEPLVPPAPTDPFPEPTPE